MKREINRVKRPGVLLITAAVSVAVGISSFTLAARAAASSDPLQLIASVRSAKPGAISATALITLQGIVRNAGDGGGGEQVLTEARALPTPVGAHASYVIPSRTGDMCFFAEGVGEWCGPPLTLTEPVQFGVEDNDGPGGTGPLAFGLAADGVESITFSEDDTLHIVPVHQNVFEFVGAPSASVNSFTNVYATFADGHQVRVTAP